MLDGNLKNRRDVCLAKDAGFISYHGLPGHVKSGCMSTPSYKSRYCKEHCERVCKSDCQRHLNGDTDGKQHTPSFLTIYFVYVYFWPCNSYA